MNRVILMGRLTRDPEVRYSQGERSAFYAGLMENNPVLNKVEAKKLLKAYFKENPDHASFFDAYEMIRECMEEDGFFKLTGLDSVQAAMNRAEEEMQKSTSEMSENQ